MGVLVPVAFLADMLAVVAYLDAVAPAVLAFFSRVSLGRAPAITLGSLFGVRAFPCFGESFWWYHMFYRS